MPLYSDVLTLNVSTRRPESCIVHFFSTVHPPKSCAELFCAFITSTVELTLHQLKSVIELLHDSSQYGRVTNSFVHSVGDALPKYKLKFSEQKRVTNSVLIRYKGHYAYLNNVVTPLGTCIQMYCLHNFPLVLEENLDPDLISVLSYFFPRRDTLCVTHLSSPTMTSCDINGIYSALLAYYGQIMIARKPRLDVLHDSSTFQLLLQNLESCSESELFLEHDPSLGPFFVSTDDLGLGFNADRGPVFVKNITYTPTDIVDAVCVDLNTVDWDDWTPLYKGHVHPLLRVEHQPLVLSDDESSSEDESNSKTKSSLAQQSAQQNVEMPGPTVELTLHQLKSVIELLHDSSQYGRVTNSFVHSVGDALPKYKLKFSEQKRVTNSVLIRYKGHYAYLNNVVTPLGTCIQMYCLHNFPLVLEENLDPDLISVLSYFFPRRDTLCVTHLSSPTMTSCDINGIYSALLAYYGQIMIARKPRLDVLHDSSTFQLLLQNLESCSESELFLEHDPSLGPFFVSTDDLGLGFNADRGPVFVKNITYTPTDIVDAVCVDLNTVDWDDWTPLYKGHVHPLLRVEHQPLVLSDDESSSEDESNSKTKSSLAQQSAQQSVEMLGRDADLVTFTKSSLAQQSAQENVEMLGRDADLVTSTSPSFTHYNQKKVFTRRVAKSVVTPLRASPSSQGVIDGYCDNALPCPSVGYSVSFTDSTATMNSKKRKISGNRDILSNRLEKDDKIEAKRIRTYSGRGSKCSSTLQSSSIPTPNSLNERGRLCVRDISNLDPCYGTGQTCP
eukprot:sb/3462262/